jgi:hypothetical protein
MSTLTLLFSLSLSIRSSVNTSLKNLVLALKLILKLVLKLAHILGVVVDVHLLGTVAALEGRVAKIGVGGSLRHGILVY